MRSALVVGGAACVWDDLRDAKALFDPDIVLAVNTIAVALKRVDHWASLHPQKFARWIELRRAKGYVDPVFWGHKQAGKAPECRIFEFEKGSSGLFATVIAKRELECDRIVLCGIPMTDTGYFDGPEGHSVKWARHLDEKYRPAWREMRSELEPHVRSMSGWTAELLGRPTRTWIEAA